jgi:alkanesulfonate monooxygenase SsuD/methylene tetrahydromethanopterin reductase-like flavin-dependent oxidoreductase (luciferase family)
MSILPATGLFVFTGCSRDEVDEALNTPFAKTFAFNVPGKEWTRHGAQHPLGEDFTGVQDLLPQVLDKQTVLSYTKDVPVSLLKETLLTGTPDDVIDRAAEWRDHGLRYAVLCNVSSMRPSLRRGLAADTPLRQDRPRTTQTLVGSVEVVAQCALPPWNVYKTPVVATRMGDVPSTVIVADPNLFQS